MDVFGFVASIAIICMFICFCLLELYVRQYEYQQRQNIINEAVEIEMDGQRYLY